MRYKSKGYSNLIKAMYFIIDLAIINGSIFLFKINITYIYIFSLYISLLWIVIALKNNFYNVKRQTKIVQIIPLILGQIIVFTLILYAFIGFFKQPNISRLALGNYLVWVFVLISFFKFVTYFLLIKYRSGFGGNIRNVVVIGRNDKTRQLIEIFDSRLDFGNKVKMQFDVNDEDFSLDKCFSFIVDKNIDEIYFSVGELSNIQINQLIDFADNNLLELKFIPDNKDIFSKKLKYEYYDYIPILSLRTIPLQDPLNKFIKRLFDILMSSAVIVFLLSWLTPIIAILIKLESKGPIFFRQARNGINYEEFNCYKFRSMNPNSKSDSNQATKEDQRVTKMGRFLRRTSIDELPQFYNVLFGSMSVIGPRPHMLTHTNLYAKRVDKFMIRHFVKPGITGLAQISGFRGEIETDQDIIGRVKHDIFYIENWSILLDFKIVFQTILNALKGEDKAY